LTRLRAFESTQPQTGAGMRKVIVAAVLVALSACGGSKKAEAPASAAGTHDSMATMSHDSMMMKDTTKHQ